MSSKTYPSDEHRRTKVFGPYGFRAPAPTIEMAYHPEQRTPAALTTHRLATAAGGFTQLRTVLFIDGLGRVLQT